MKMRSLSTRSTRSTRPTRHVGIALTATCFSKVRREQEKYVAATSKVTHLRLLAGVDVGSGGDGVIWDLRSTLPDRFGTARRRAVPRVVLARLLDQTGYENVETVSVQLDMPLRWA